MTADTPSPLVPKLRFPEFRDARVWSSSRLESVCEILNNRRVPITTIDRKAGPFPYYGASGVVDYVDSFIFDERLILVGEDGAKWDRFEQTAFIADGKYWVNNHAHVLRSVDLIDSFLEAYLVRSDLGRYVTGAAPPKLTLGKLKLIPIPMPSSPAEQKKIADCLGSLDDLIVAESRKLESLRQHKKGLIQQLFPRPDETIPQLRFPEFQKTPPWLVQKLSDLYEFKRTNTLTRDKLNYEIGTTKNIHYGDIHTKFKPLFRVEDENVPYVNPGILVSGDSDAFCEEGDIVLADASEDIDDIGKAIEIISLNGACVVAGTHTILATRRGSIPIVGFGGQLFQSAAVRAGIKKEAQGAKVYGISSNRISAIPIPIPPTVVEQKKIADCLGSLDDLIVAEGQKLESLRQHKKGLMQQLFPDPETI